jgi:hypothetical protein
MVIETRVIAKGTYSEKDRKALDAMIADYARETQVSDLIVSHEFWRGLKEGKSMAVMAVDRETQKPLGFIDMEVRREKGKAGVRLINFYAVPEVRKRSLSMLLAKKAYMLGRMMRADKISASYPMTRKGEKTVQKFESLREDWKKIPQERFLKFDEFTANLRKRKRD